MTSFGISGLFKLFQHNFHVSHSYLKSVGIVRENRIPRGANVKSANRCFSSRKGKEKKKTPSSSLDVSRELHHLAAVTGN